MSHKPLNLLLSLTMLGDSRTENLRPACDTWVKWQPESCGVFPAILLGLWLSAKLQMCPGKRSFKLAKEPLLFLGVGAASALGSRRRAMPWPNQSVCHCRASWHQGTPWGQWLLLCCCLLQGATCWWKPNISILESKESIGRAPGAQHQVCMLPCAFSGMAWVHLLSFVCGGAGCVPSPPLLLSFLSKACALSNLGQPAHHGDCCKLTSRRWKNAHLEARRHLVPVWFSFGGLSVVDWLN